MKDTIKTYPLEGGRVLTLAGARTSTLDLPPEVQAQVGLKTIVTVGHSFKNPEDKESPAKLGETIAKGRSMKAPIFHAVVSSKRISKECVAELMDAIAKEVSLNLGGFLPLSNGKSRTTQQRETKVESNRVLDTTAPNKGAGVRDAKVQTR